MFDLFCFQSLLANSAVQTASAIHTSVQRIVTEASQAREAGVDDWQVAPKFPEWPIKHHFLLPLGGVLLKVPLPFWVLKPKSFWTSQMMNTTPVARGRLISITSLHMSSRPS